MRLAVLCSACACACAPTSDPHPTTLPVPVPAPVPETTPAASRAFGVDATFGDLVRLARVLIRNRQAESSAGCLLKREPLGYDLRADLMPALDGLPDAPAELDSQLQRSAGPLGILTAYGPTAGGDSALMLATFTAVAPRAPRAAAVAIILTNEGAYLRYGATNAIKADGPLPIDAAVARLLATSGNASAVIYVTAEAAVGVADLAQLLRLLPSDREVAFAIALPPGTTLPKPTAALAPDVDRCPDGLPETDSDAAQGDLDRAGVLAAIAPLQDQAQQCLDSARGPAKAGGRVVVALRIAADGSVARACMLGDAIGDAALAACVLSNARELHFARPAPTGVVDVHLPLALQPGAPAAQRAWCE